MEEKALLKKKARKISNIGFNFDPLLHKYTYDGIEMPSATGIIKKYTKEFNSAMVARGVAKKTKRSASAIQSQWTTTGQISSNFGNFIHETANLYYLNKDTLTTWYGGLSPHQEIVIKMLDAITKEYEIVEAEKPRCSLIYRIGYTGDLLLKHKITGKYVMADYKTTKVTDNEDYRNMQLELKGKAKNAGYLKEPFKSRGLRDVPFDKVAIQLSMYSIFMAHDQAIPYFSPKDLPNIDRWVIHIPINPKKYLHPDGSIKGYKVTQVINVDAEVYRVLGS